MGMSAGRAVRGWGIGRTPNERTMNEESRTMMQTIPDTMQAAALDRFGGIETLTLQTLSVPEVGPDDVLIRLEAAGVGSWDRGEREGRYAEYLGAPTFPYVLGWEGAGTIAAVGERVGHFKQGDRVYAAAYAKRNGGGFYAQYAAVKADDVAHVPDELTIEQAGVMGWDALTALTGVDDVLHIRPGEALMVFGASGGVGHMAVQIARRLGADAVVNGREDDVRAAALRFAPDGLDAGLVTAGGAAADQALGAMRD